MLLGSGAVLLTGCADGKAGPEAGPSTPTATATATGPNIVKQRTGTVVLPEQTSALSAQLTEATSSADVQQLMDLIQRPRWDRKKIRTFWERRLRNFERLGFVDSRWYVGVPTDRTRNAAGGLVKYSGELVFAHTVQGCDAREVVETFDADFRMSSPEAPLELMHLGGSNADFAPSIWDVAEVDAIETEHARIVFGLGDAAVARSRADEIEEGARRAFDRIPNPRGVEKVLYALTWPEIDGQLYGGVAVGEADAHAYYHPFLDPATLATGQRKRADDADLPLATGRVGMHRSSLARRDFVDVACHEAVHVLACQWQDRSGHVPWATEGYAKWAEGGGAALMARWSGLIRSGFATFARTAPLGYAEFHDVPPAVESANYLCAGAVYAYLEETRGAEAAHALAAAYYRHQDRADAAKEFGTSERDLIAAARKWAGA